MSDSEDSTVTYTEAPPSPDYVPGPEEPEQAPPSLDFVPEPVYPEFMPLEDDVLPAEEQPLPAAVSPTANSPGYITEFDPEEDPEEDDEDPKEDPADYPTNRNDKEEEEEESSRDDADDEEEEEEEHLALADSVLPPACRTTARMSIRDQTPIPFQSAAEFDKFLTISTPPPLPLTSYSSPLPHIPSPTLPVSSPLPVSPPPLPASPTHPLGYRAAMIRLRVESPSTSHPLPIILPHTRASIAGVYEVTLPPRKRLCIILGLRFEVGESSSSPTARPNGEFRRDYGFVATLDDEIRQDLERDIELSQRMTDFVRTVRQDTDEIYERLDNAQDDRSLMRGQLNLLHRDRRSHAYTARVMENEARLSHEAWVQSMDASDTTRSEVRALRTTMLAQQTGIRELRVADCRRQTQLTKALTLLRTLQTQMAALQS
ncbi:hypothetical protein Tco_0382397 [Tanacetum coccineum]